MRSCFGWRSLFALAGLCSVLAGCKRVELPRTYPATGSVRDQDGQPMKGGLVQFIPVESDRATEIRVTGTIQEDGTFKLETLKDKHKLIGAPEGEYRAIVILPLQGDDKHKGVPPISLPGTWKVEAKENQFSLELTPPPG